MTIVVGCSGEDLATIEGACCSLYTRSVFIQRISGLLRARRRIITPSMTPTMTRTMTPHTATGMSAAVSADAPVRLSAYTSCEASAQAFWPTACLFSLRTIDTTHADNLTPFNKRRPALLLEFNPYTILFETFEKLISIFEPRYIALSFDNRRLLTHDVRPLLCSL